MRGNSRMLGERSNLIGKTMTVLISKSTGLMRQSRFCMAWRKLLRNLICVYIGVSAQYVL